MCGSEKKAFLRHSRYSTIDVASSAESDVREFIEDDSITKQKCKMKEQVSTLGIL